MHDTRDVQLAKDAEVTKQDAIIQSLKKRLRKEERHSRTLAKRVERIRTFAELSIDGEALPVKVMDTLTKEGMRRLAEDTVPGRRHRVRAAQRRVGPGDRKRSG